MSSTGDAERWLDTLWGERAGYCVFAFGIDGYFSETGKYEFKHWHERPGRWPDDRDRFLDDALERAVEEDVYVAPYLRSKPSRKKDVAPALPSCFLYADVDELDDGVHELVRDLVGPSGLVVDSGEGLHVYPRLPEELEPAELERLNRHLAHRLGADSGWAENKMLRLPGTWNHKGRAGGGEPRWVSILDGDRAERDWSLDELVERLGSAPPDAGGAVASITPATPETVPGRVLRRLLEKPEGDRSKQTYAFVGACLEAGLSDEATMWLALEHTPTKEKFGERAAGDVERAIRKHREKSPRVAEPAVRFVTIDEFVAHPVPQAEPIAVDATGSTVLAAIGFVLTYGDGGAGKTTLWLDGGMHLAAGEPWLDGLFTPTRALRVGWVENEGPQEEFRRKLERKRDAWTDRVPADRFHVLDRPWGELNLANERHRQGLADATRVLDLDLLIIGPLNDLGMKGGGTPDEVRDFHRHLKNVQARARRLVSLIVLHHENVAGRVSGAWTGRPDLLVHVIAQGHGKTRVYWQKAKWSSALHGTTSTLAWSDGEGFKLAEEGLARPERVWGDVEQYVLEHGGTPWNPVEAAVSGSNPYKRRRRDAMLAEGVLINTGKGQAFELWHRDDPARPTLDTTAPNGGRGVGAVAPDTGGEEAGNHRARAPYVSRGAVVPPGPPAAEIACRSCGEPFRCGTGNKGDLCGDCVRRELEHEVVP